MNIRHPQDPLPPPRNLHCPLSFTPSIHLSDRTLTYPPTILPIYLANRRKVVAQIVQARYEGKLS